MGAGEYYRIGDPSMDTAGLCIEQTNDVVVATATMQYLTEPEATALVDELIGCIRYDAAHFFVLNLTQVQRITSSAIQALLILFQELEHVRVSSWQTANRTSSPSSRQRASMPCSNCTKTSMKPSKR